MKVATGIAGGQKGISLIATSFLILALGLASVAGLRLYGVWHTYHMDAITNGRLDDIQQALQRYATHNGRYPCPAPLDVALDQAGFGVEVSTDCTAGEINGTFRAAGRGGRIVRTGAVPVRTLNLADYYSFDGFKQRYVYAVTEDYAVADVPVSGDMGAIQIVDSNGNNATAAPGNIIEIVYSMGWDTNGAYSIDGVNLQACDSAARSGENCDFDDDAVFMNTIGKSTNTANLFVHSLSYVPSKTMSLCDASAASTNKARNTAFLIDTSLSMTEGGLCPANMPGCSRIDVARWSLRRVVPALVYNNSLEDAPGQMWMTGFVAQGSTRNVERNLGNITFFDPDEFDQDANNDGVPDREDMEAFVEGKSAQLESEIMAMCPQGNTPLGIHMEALAVRLRDQTQRDIAADGIPPSTISKIAIISDGLSNNGTSPDIIANQIQAMRSQNPPVNIQVDIIDVVGNPSLQSISEMTGGKYYRTDNPDELLKALYDSAGVCAPYTPPSIVDQPGCGSSGNWGSAN